MESNYEEIQSKTTKAVIERLGLGKFKDDKMTVECQTDFELVDKAEYAKLEHCFLMVEAKSIKIEHENLKQAKAIEVS